MPVVEDFRVSLLACYFVYFVILRLVASLFNVFCVCFCDEITIIYNVQQSKRNHGVVCLSTAAN